MVIYCWFREVWSTYDHRISCITYIHTHTHTHIYIYLYQWQLQLWSLWYCAGWWRLWCSDDRQSRCQTQASWAALPSAFLELPAVVLKWFWKPSSQAEGWWWNMVKHGGTWWNMVEHGGTWSNMVKHSWPINSGTIQLPWGHSGWVCMCVFSEAKVLIAASDGGNRCLLLLTLVHG